MDIADAGLVHCLVARHSPNSKPHNIGLFWSYIDLSILLPGFLLKS